jgi:RHS repeat-associated protein
MTDKVSEIAYHKGGQLMRAEKFNGRDFSHTYDRSYNRWVTKVDGTATQDFSQKYNAGNQLTATNNTYDGRGNQTKTSHPAVTTMTYNAPGQMTSSKVGSTTTDYAYAGQDQVELTKLGSTSLVYGGTDQHGMPWLQSWTSGGKTVYVERDGRGTPLGLRVDDKDYFFVTDSIGSVVAVVGLDEKVAASYTYDPYGPARSTSETGLPTTNLLRYTGAVYDATTEYTHLGQRWYNADQGRFTQQDSITRLGDLSDGNRYAYAAANPITKIDPTGQGQLETLVGGVTGGVVAGVIVASGGGFLAAALIGGCAGGVIEQVLSQGDFGDAVRGCLVGGVVGGVSYGIGKAAMAARGASGG